MTPEQQVRWLLDRTQITETLHEWMRILDTQKISDLSEVFTEDCALEFPVGTLLFEQMLANIEQSAVQAQRQQTDVAATHHMLSNPQIEIKKDRAQTRTNVQAV